MTKDPYMRARHLIAIVTVVLIAIAVKPALLPASVAKAGHERPGLDVSQMHLNRTLPEQAVRDMSFVTDNR
jgi:hypothetical protein